MDNFFKDLRDCGIYLEDNVIEAELAEVTLVLKSGDFEDPCNNRPISLLPMLSKVSERLAHRQLVDYLTKKKKLAKSQSGNCKLHSMETALLCVTDDLLLAMDNRSVCCSVTGHVKGLR